MNLQTVCGTRHLIKSFLPLFMSLMISGSLASHTRQTPDEDVVAQQTLTISNPSIAPPAWLLGGWTNYGQSNFVRIVRWEFTQGIIRLYRHDQNTSPTSESHDCAIIRQTVTDDSYTLGYSFNGDEFLLTCRKFFTDWGKPSLSLSLSRNGTIIRRHTKDAGSVLGRVDMME